MRLEDIKKIAVIGAGTMGPGIAQIFALGGYEVSLWTRSEETLKKSLEIIKQNFELMAQGDMIKAEEIEPAAGRIHATTDLKEAIRGAQLIQETAVENPDIKRELFAEFEEVIEEDAIVVTNTSALDPFPLVPEKRLPYFCTAHWYAPPHILPLVECAKCDKTKDETVETVMALLEKCGKVPVRLEKFIPGHMMTRILIAMSDEIYSLLDNGIASPEMIDKAAKASIFPRGIALGLVQRYDFTGIDLSCKNIINGKTKRAPHNPHPNQLFDHYEKGEYGVKTGKGFFDYSGRDASEVLAERDRRLIQIVNATKDLMDKPV